MLTARAMLLAGERAAGTTSLTMAPFRNTPLAQGIAVFHDLD